MTVAFKSSASSENLNNAFMSKNADSTTTGVFTLNAPLSGDQIDNLQLELNGKTFHPYAVQQVTAGGEISISTTKGMQRRKIQSDGGAIIASATPFGTSGGWVDGMQIRLRGNSDTNTVQLSGVDVASSIDYGIIINGTIVLEKFVQITLEWDADELRWYEISRNS